MPLYRVLYIQPNTTVGQYLREKPAIQNPNVTIPRLIRCNGVVHYTRSGIRTVVTQENYQLQNGEFLFVADQCPTGRIQVVTSVPSNDYAFIMGAGGDFYECATNYMNRRPRTQNITTIRSLEEILQTLSRSELITGPISNLIIVSHATEQGMLYFNLNARDTDARIYLDELCPFVKNKVRTQITERIIRNHANTNVYIRGCNIGRKIDFLRFFKQIFGDKVTVTAPIHKDNFLDYTLPQPGPGGRLVNQTEIHCEFMSECFTVHKRPVPGGPGKKKPVTTKAKNKKELIRLFFDRKFAVNNRQITEEQLKKWIPDNIHQELEIPHECNNPIEKGMGKLITREYRGERIEIHIQPIYIREDEKKPKKQAEKIELLRRKLRNEEKMKPNYPNKDCPYPLYMRWGFTNLDDFIDNLDWIFEWDPSETILTCTGSRYTYELRIPITDDQNMVILNAVAGSGTKRYLYHDIKETDRRFFASV